MTISTTIMRILTSKHVGTDARGNRYFVSRLKNAEGQYTRSVAYAEGRDPTSVAPSWHRWLHYTTDLLPDPSNEKPYPWVAEKQPNPTGTDHAYFPPGHIFHMEHRKHMEDHYEPWDGNRTAEEKK